MSFPLPQYSDTANGGQVEPLPPLNPEQRKQIDIALRELAIRIIKVQKASEKDGTLADIVDGSMDTWVEAAYAKEVQDIFQSVGVQISPRLAQRLFNHVAANATIDDDLVARDPETHRVLVEYIKEIEAEVRRILQEYMSDLAQIQIGDIPENVLNEVIRRVYFVEEVERRRLVPKDSYFELRTLIIVTATKMLDERYG